MVLYFYLSCYGLNAGYFGSTNQFASELFRAILPGVIARISKFEIFPELWTQCKFDLTFYVILTYQSCPSKKFRRRELFG